MTNEKLIEELAKDRSIEQETIKMLDGMYLKKPSKPDVDMLIGLHEKKIRELEMSKVDPQIEAIKMKQLRREVMGHMVEKQMSNDALEIWDAQNDVNRSKIHKGMV